jgi:hypothetical protein
MDGFIIINRSIINWEWYTNINTCRLFEHILYTASFEDTTWRGIDVKRSELITSYNSLSNSTGLSIQNVKTALKNLKKSKDITIKTTTKYQVITVLSYDKYTLPNKQNNKQANRKVTTSKEYKEDIKKDNLKVIKKSKLKSSKIQVERDENDFAIIPNDYFQYSKELGLSEEAIHHEFNRFANYYESISGSKSKRDNWYRAWQSWLTSPYNKGSQSTNNSGNSTTSAIGKVTDELRKHPIASSGRPKSAYSDI